MNTKAHSVKLVLLVGLAVSLTSCADRPPRMDWEIPNLPRWEVGEEPIRSVGVVDGDPEYQFFRVTSAVRFGDSLLVVANTGTNELRFYDDAGRFRFDAGGYGEGPGEFKWLRGIVAAGPDTVVAFDDTRRLSYFSLQGEYLGVRPAPQSRFPFDWWLYRKNFVVGVPLGPQRREVASSLDRLPMPPQPPGYWYVLRDPTGFLWASNGPDPDGGRRRWTVFGDRGAALAEVELPARFEILEITENDLLGRWRDELGVEFVRVYPLNRGDSADPGAPVAAVAQGSLPVSGSAQGILDNSMGVLRQVVTLQERFFSRHGRYTANRNDLDWDMPEGMTLDLITVSGTGWVGILTQVESPLVCGIGLGSATPPGWREGVPTCADVDAGST